MKTARTRLAIPGEELALLGGWRGQALDFVGREGDDVALLVGGNPFRIVRCESEHVPGVARVAVRGAAVAAVGGERGLGAIRELKLVTGVIARAPAPSFAKYAEYVPPLTVGDFVFCDPRLAGGEEGVEADVGLFLVTERIHVCVYVSPLETGARVAIPGPLGNGEYGGTTVSRAIFES